MKKYEERPSDRSSFLLCQICAISMPKHMVIDRISSNGQNGANDCLTSFYAIPATISEVMKNHQLGFEVRRSIRLSYRRTRGTLPSFS